MPTITFGMIAKNEEKNLPELLNRMKKFVDEMIVIDTGSTDKTVELAETLGAKVIHHRWQLNMAAARDEYIKAATCDYILSLDGDERITEHDLSHIKELIEANPHIMGFYLVKRDYGLHGVMRPDDDHYEESKPYRSWIEVREIRVFKNNKKLHYTHYVHTDLTPAIQAQRGALADMNGIVIHHFRHELSSEQKKAKHKLYLQMLELEAVHNPTDPLAYAHLAAEYGPDNETKAIENYEKAIKLITAHAKEGRDIPRSHALIASQLGILYMEKRNLKRARELFELAIDLHSPDARTYSSLGEIELFEKHHEKARELFLKSRDLGHPQPAFVNSRLNMIAKELGLVEQYF